MQMILISFTDIPVREPHAQTRSSPIPRILIRRSRIQLSIRKSRVYLHCRAPPWLPFLLSKIYHNLSDASPAIKNNISGARLDLQPIS